MMVRLALLRALALQQLSTTNSEPPRLPRAPLLLAGRAVDHTVAHACDAAFASSVNTTGLVSIVPFLAVTGMDDATAVDAAVNMSSGCQAGVVYCMLCWHLCWSCCLLWTEPCLQTRPCPALS